MQIDILDDTNKLSRIPAASKDFLIASQVLEHTEAPIAVVENWLAAVKPGGLLIIMLPNKCACADMQVSALCCLLLAMCIYIINHHHHHHDTLAHVACH